MNDKGQKILLLILVLSFLLSIFAVMALSMEEPTVSARAAALYEPSTKRFIYQKNAKTRLGMASTTKIMTALVTLEQKRLDDTVKIDPRAVGVEGSSLYLKAGEVLTVEDLLYALMLRSANDAALALAYDISGSVEAFAQLMNEKAGALGLTDTHFENPHGLDSENHYTTAEELAIIAAAALEREEFRTISKTYQKTLNDEYDRLVVNHNKLLKLYDGAIGVKTGFTKKCGRTLVGAAERDGLTLISVTLDAPNDWSDHTKLFDLGYSLYEAKTLVGDKDFTYSLPLLDRSGEYVTVAPEGTLRVVRKKTDPTIREEIRLPRYLTSPISEGDILGAVIFTDGEDFTETVRLVAKSSTSKEKEKRFFGLF